MKTTLNYSVILALIFIVMQLIGMLTGLATESWFKWASFPITLALYFILLKRLRDQELGGFISYSKVLGQGTLMGLYSGVMVGVFMFMYLEFVDASFIESTLQQTYNEYQKAGMSDAQIEQAMPFVEKFMSPIWMAFWSIVGSVFSAFISALIAGIFVKKEGSPFQTIDG